MSVVALARTTSVNLNGWSTGIELTAVVPNPEDDPHAEEIKAFHAATPSLSFKAQIRNELAAEQFQPGAAFYIRLERAPEHDAKFPSAA